MTTTSILNGLAGSLASLAMLVLPSLAATSGTDSCRLAPEHIVEINQALSKPECKGSEFLDGVPDLNGRTIDSVDVVFSPTTRVFRGQERTIVQVRQIVLSDAEWAKTEFAGIVANETPKDSCDDISAGGIGYSIQDRALVADFDVHYQQNTCTKSTCFKGWGKGWLGIPYPIFASCMAKTNVPGMSATIAVRTVMTPSLVMLPDGQANIQIVAVPSAGVKEGPSELVKNIVGALTFGIGSKAIQDQFDHAVGDFKASLSPRLESVAMLKLPEPRHQVVEIQFVPEQPYFLNGAGHLEFAVSRLATVQPSIACSLKQKAVEAHKFFQSCVNPQRQYLVQNNDSLWKIAQNLYGEGQYYHAIRQHNNFTESQAFGLRTGQVLSVVPFYEIAGPDSVLVSYGDTLWKIAGRRMGNPLLYRQLLKNNRGEIKDPDTLITLVSLKTKTADSGSTTAGSVNSTHSTHPVRLRSHPRQ